MKRTFAIFITLFLILTGCNKGTNKFEFPLKAKYFVTEEESGVVFEAVFDGEYREYAFISPQTLSGLCVTTNDGVTYNFSYKSMETQLGSNAIEVASDFSAAVELLKTSKLNKNKFFASADAIYAEGIIENENITAIEFFNGAVKRRYKIKTEV